MSEQGEQVSVNDAARRMGVTPRAVLKLLHAGRLRGSKEGKSWRIDAASLAELLRERGPALPLHPAGAGGQVPAQPAGGVEGRPAGPRPPAAAPAEGGPALPPRPLRARRGRDETWSFVHLGAWERLHPVAIQVLRALDAEGGHGAQGLLRERARDAVLSALTHLAQGYHCYHGRDKTDHYAQAREGLCSAACALLVLAGLDADRASTWQRLADELQGEPLGSITGLIRVTEGRRSRGRRGQQGRDDAAEIEHQEGEAGG